MRDPERIKPLLQKLEALWQRHPDMRLCQLLVGLSESATWNGFWNVEDDKILARLLEYEAK
jgi:uncharacterized protein YihD (DUF1040 family)